jgi:hypothetical protein
MQISGGSTNHSERLAAIWSKAKDREIVIQGGSPLNAEAAHHSKAGPVDDRFVRGGVPKTGIDKQTHAMRRRDWRRFGANASASRASFKGLAHGLYRILQVSGATALREDGHFYRNFSRDDLVCFDTTIESA